MSYFGVSLRNGVGLGLGTVPSLTNTPLSYRLAPSLDLSFAGSDALSPAITFSRTTNATVTGSNGLIQNAPMNLLTFSEQFDNAAWTKSNATITANAVVAPNGTTTADTFVSTATGGASSGASQSVTGSVASYTFSVYAKAGTIGFIRLAMTSNTVAAAAWFNLATGVVGTVESGVTASITAAGNGWYRCSVTRTLAAVSETCFIRLADLDNSLSAPSGSTLSTWGAQLEVGSTATTYNPTTVKNLLGFTEHFDNAAWAKSNAFVQTNLLTYSQDFDNAAWTDAAPGSTVTVTANSSVAPDGSTTADTLAPNVGGTNAMARQVRTLAASTAYAGSLYIKAGTSTQSRVLLRDTTAGTNFADATINWSGGVPSIAGGATGTWTVAFVNNGWYRLVGFGNSGATASPLITFSVFPDASAGTGNLLVWGAQLVQGTSAGDYKATYAAAAAVGYTDIYGQPFAQKLVETAATGTHFVFQNNVALLAGTTYTLSCYLKAGERNWAIVSTYGSAVWGSNDGGVFINLSTGALGNTFGTAGAVSVTNVGNGWYRVTTTRTAQSAGTQGMLVAVAQANGSSVPSYTGDGTSGIYIFGAQLSDSASVDPYVYQPVAAPTSTAYYGPRFDYDPVTLAPKGLLIEEQRSNLLLNSATLSTQVVTVAATAHTLSFYGTGTIVLSGASTGTVVGTGAYPARTTLTFTPTVGVLTLTVTGSVTMAQLEAGAFATSYIPTVASQVTRAADSASMIGNNFARWFNQTEGTVYTQADVSVPSAVNAAVFSLGSTTSDIMRIFRQTDAQPVAQVITGGAAQATMGLGASWTTTAAQKIAFAYATNNFSATTNGGTTITDTSGTVPVVSQAVLGNAAGIGALNGHLTRIAFYSRVLSGAEQKGITA